MCTVNVIRGHAAGAAQGALAPAIGHIVDPRGTRWRGHSRSDGESVGVEASPFKLFAVEADKRQSVSTDKWAATLHADFTAGELRKLRPNFATGVDHCISRAGVECQSSARAAPAR